ncbi:amino acid adenylation domain-containing protein [Paenibacillus sp. S33]
MDTLFEKEKLFWRNMISSEDRISSFPYNKSSNKDGIINSQLSKHRHRFSQNVQRKLEALSKGSKGVEFLILLTGVQFLLYKYTEDSQTIVGIPVISNSQEDLSPINEILFLKADVEEYNTFKTLVKQNQRAVKEVLKHSNIPFQDMTGQLEIEYHNNGKPIVDTVIYYSALHNLNFINDAIVNLLLGFEMEQESIYVNVSYNPDVYSQDYILRLTAHLEHILIQMMNEPDLEIHKVGIMTEEEKEKQCIEFNRTNENELASATVQKLFEQQAKAVPEKVAVTYENVAFTYRELNERSNRLARTLRTNGVQSGHLVGLMVERSVEMIIGILAILKSGGAYVPLDPDYPENRIQYMLKDSGISVILIQEHLKEKIAFEGKVLALEDKDSYSEDQSNLELVNSPQDIAYVIYTSGTTGTPKGILTTHENIIRVVSRTNYIDFQEGDHILQLSNYAFDGSTFDIFGSLLNGSKLTLIGKDTLLDIKKLAYQIRDKQITVVFITTALFNMLIDQDVDCFVHVRKVLFGGERASVEHTKKALKELGPHKLIQVYGPTESTVFATYYEVNEIDDTDVHIPIGKPISQTQVYVLSKKGELQPLGVPGELWIGGKGLAHGYLNRPELNNEKFVTGLLNSNERLYRTGDLVRWLPKGNLEFLGRIDQQVKIRGHRIELGEIEAQLLKISGIQKALVTTVENEHGEKEVCAYLETEQPFTIGELRATLGVQLPAFMIPAYFIRLESFPLTLNGKIDLKSLPHPKNNIWTGAEYQAPETVIEERLVQIWKELLGIENIGVKDNFFELGGQSLKASSMVTKIYQHLGVDLSLKQIFQYPTIKEIANWIADKQGNFEPIPLAEERSSYPLSSAQKRLYALSLLSNHDLSYNMPAVFSVEGPLNRNDLQQALNKLIQRHESLRTSFVNTNEGPIQRVNPVVQFLIEYFESTEEDCQKVIQNFIRAFDLKMAPLLRVGLIEITSEHHLLMFDMHHIISDGVSMENILKEITLLLEGENLPVLHIQYKDYAVWQQDKVQQERMKKQETYWINTFSNEMQTYELPTDYNRPNVRDFSGNLLEFTLDPFTSEKLRQITAESGTTLYMILLTSYFIFLYKYTDQEDITIGTPVAGRTHPDLDHLIGMFVNTLALRSYPAGHKTFMQFLQEVRETVLLAFENQEYPLETLVEKLELSRDLSRNPLFDTMFTLQTASSQEAQIPGWNLSAYPIEHKVAKFDLSFHANVETSTIRFSIEYATSLFKQGTIQRMGLHFQNIIRSITQDVQIILSDINILTADEEEKIWKTYNTPKIEFMDNKTIHGLFEEQVSLVPNKVAVVCEKTHLTYRELDERSSRLANYLHQEGVKKEEIIGLMTERSVEMIIGMLAILKVGGGYLPIDPELPKDRIHYMLNDSGASLLLTTHNLTEKATFDGKFIYLDEEKIYMEQDLHIEFEVFPSNLAYVIYTSGTTGKPKGVMLEHRGICNLKSLYTNTLQITEQDRIVQFSNFSFDACTWEISQALFSGATLYIPRKNTILDAERFTDYLIENNITVATLPPSYAVHLNPERIVSLTKLITAGSSTSLEFIKKWANRVQYFNAYGPTEDSVCSTVWSVPSFQNFDSIQAVSIGKPIQNHQAFILNRDNQLQPVGIPGELCIAGVGLARGYLNLEDLTAQKFVVHPLNAQMRLYKTGDLAKWMPNGKIEYLGRIDHQVKIRGFRIEIGEVENRLANIEGIQDVIVITRQDVRDDNQLYAYYVASKQFEIEVLKSELAKVLPEYMIPSYFVKLEKMPLTTNGKIDRKALPIPDLGLAFARTYIAPRNTMEHLLASIWQHVLGVERIGIEDHFFDLGGDSIKAIQVSSRLFEAGYRFEIRDLFKNPTIKQLAGHIQSILVKTNSCEINGDVKLTPIQRWFFELNKEPHHFNQSFMLYRKKGFDEDLLHQVLQKLTEQHDALRILFRYTSDGYEAWNRPVGDESAYILETEDYRHYDKNDAFVEMKANAVQRSINISQGPLIKLVLFHCQDGDHLLIVIHHLVVDGVSWRILLEDFTSMYSQLEKKQTIKLPPKTDSFQSWALKISEYAQSPDLESEFEYWQGIHHTATELLPRDAKIISKQNQNTEYTVKMTAHETELLLKSVHRAYNTQMDDLLLAALGMSLRDWKGMKRVAVSLEGHGRESIFPEVNISRTVGWFTSMYPVILDMTAEHEISTDIKRIKENIRQIPHKGINYGIIRYLTNSKALQNELHAEISFNYFGSFDRNFQSNEFELSPYPRGEEVSNKFVSGFSLMVNGYIMDGELSLSFLYNCNYFRDESIESLAGYFKANLQKIISHCLDKEPEITPSDLQIKGLTFEELEHILNETREIGRVENTYTLTPIQNGMLYHNQVSPESNAYFEQTAFTMEGPLNISIFKECWNDLLKRHAVLRTNFYTNLLAVPIQIVYREKQLQFYYEDLRDLNFEDQRSHLQNYKEQDRLKGFDLASDTLMRVATFRVQDHAYEILWSFHHILIDGWSLPLIMKEILGTYRAFQDHLKPDYPPASPYSEYIRWLEEQDRKTSLQYWSNYLGRYDQQTVLPKKNIKIEGYRSDKVSCELGASLSQRIHEVARQYGATVNVLLQTLWGILLHKYNNNHDAVFGSVVSGRQANIPGIEHMVGLFINTIPVRIQCSPNETFSDLLCRMQEQALRSHQHDYYSLYEIQAHTSQKQDLINHIMIFENYPVEKQMQATSSSPDEISITAMSAVEQTNYDLNVVVVPAEQLTIHFEYNALVYASENMELLKAHFLRMIEQVAERPSLNIEEIELITESEKELILNKFNHTQVSYPEADLIFRLFEQQVERTPDQIALVLGNKKLTYRELNRRANQLGHTLRAKGVQANQIVGIMTERSLEMVVGILAVLKSGAAYVPIDPEYPEERTRHILSDSVSQILLLQRKLENKISYKGSKVFLDDEQHYSDKVDNLEPNNDPNSLAYVIYTSGTTGQPKGVMIEHRSITNTILWKKRSYDFSGNDHVLMTSTFVFDSFITHLLGPLVSGATVYMLNDNECVDTHAIREAIVKWGISHIQSTPGFLFQVLEVVNKQDLATLKNVVVGGEQLNPVLVHKLKSMNSSVEICNEYGPTENSVVSTMFSISQIGQPISIGKPIDNVQVYILGPRDQVQPIQVAGELCISGAGLSRGYLHLPDLTAEKFIDHPFLDGHRIYRTGDLARWLPDGNIEYLGRIDQQVKIRGFRVELGEIEAHLSAIDTIKNVVVTVHEGQNGKQLCAYFVAGRELTSTDLRERLILKLPEYMIPTYFVQLEKMPLSLNGKVDWKALPAPDENNITTVVEYIAPEHPLESILSQVYQEILGVHRVGIQDHFFDLGGDSIKAIQVSSRLHQVGYKLEMKDIFRFPTISQLKDHVLPLTSVADQNEVEGKVEITPIQKWFFKQGFADQHHFNQSVMLYSQERLNAISLRSALDSIVTHHDALRLRFRAKNNNFEAWNYRVEQGPHYFLEVVDLRAKNNCEEIIVAKANDIQGSFRLSDGPLIKLALFQCDDGDHLLIVVHHLVVDGVSWRILFEDITGAYEQIQQGHPVSLPDKTDSFQKWAKALLTYADSPEAGRELVYWKQIAETPIVPIPTDSCYDNSTMGDSRSVTVELSKEETELLLKHSNRPYNTELNDILLAALALALYSWTGICQTLVSVEGHGREKILEDIDMNRTIGWFTSEYPVLLNMVPDKDLSHQIKMVKESLRSVPKKGIGYGILRYLSTNPQRQALECEPEINFNYLGQFDQDFENNKIKLSHYSCGSDVSRSLERKHKISLNGLVSGGKLSINIGYSMKQYKSSSIERLAAQLYFHLQEIISHTINRDCIELTPSDLSLQGVTLYELDQMTKYTQDQGDIEDMYLLTPLQQGMLFHNLLEPYAGMYFQQLSFSLHTQLDEEAFKYSWNHLLARHAILRTNFYGKWGKAPLQIVFRNKRMDYKYTDIRGLEVNERDKLLKKYQERDRQRGFNLEKDVLMRVAVWRTGEATYEVLWSFHHILMDGWCISHVAKELFDVYNAYKNKSESNLQPVIPFKTYIRWLGQQDKAIAAAYWKDLLKDYAQPSQLPQNKNMTNKYVRESVIYSLGEHLTDLINKTSKKLNITVNSIFQTVWGMILQSYSGSRDVVFGSVVSGRQAQIKGIERIIGLFANTIPVRIRCDQHEKMVDVLIRTQQQALMSHSHDYYPLYEIQASALPRRELLDHVMFFENYPLNQEDQNLENREENSLRISNIDIFEQTNYDLNLYIIPGDNLTIHFVFNSLAYDKSFVEQVGKQWLDILERVANHPKMQVVELQNSIVKGKWESQQPTDSLHVQHKMDEHIEKEPLIVAPESPIEETLINIWKNILDIKTLGVTDNFFLLGGHSLQAVQLLQQLQTMMNIDISLNVIMEQPTIRGLAQEIMNRNTLKI